MRRWHVETVLAEAGKQAPYIVALIVLVGLFLATEERREKNRVANAKELEDRREAHEREINNMWANSIKMIVESQDKSHQMMMESLKQHELASRERYERMAKTDDLIQAVRERNAGRK